MPVVCREDREDGMQAPFESFYIYKGGCRMGKKGMADIEIQVPIIWMHND